LPMAWLSHIPALEAEKGNLDTAQVTRMATLP